MCLQICDQVISEYNKATISTCGYDDYHPPFLPDLIFTMDVTKNNSHAKITIAAQYNAKTFPLLTSAGVAARGVVSLARRSGEVEWSLSEVWSLGLREGMYWDDKGPSSSTGPNPPRHCSLSDSISFPAASPAWIFCLLSFSWPRPQIATSCKRLTRRNPLRSH
jgi:hypothetical protein